MFRETVIVIGAGMVGVACALRLQAAGRVVTLVDPGPDERASSFGNAGHIAVEQVEPLASWATVQAAPRMAFGLGGPLDFRLRDVAVWGPWARRYLAACGRDRVWQGTEALRDLAVPAVRAWRDLLDLSGTPELMREDGHAVLWFNAAEADRGRRKWATADTGPATFRPLSDGDCAAYRDQLTGRRPIAGLRFSGTARLISPSLVREALLAAFAARGGERLLGEACALSPQGVVDLVDGRQLSADQVLVAAGARSAPLMAGIGAHVPLIAERGYSIQFPAPRWPADLPTAVIEDQSIVLAPQAEGLRATSYVEFARPDSPPDSRKWDRLIDRVRAMGLEVPDDCQRWMGCRPTLPDYVPAIGAWPGRRILYAFGHQHLGITLAAITAERMVGLADLDFGDVRLNIQRFAA